MESTNDRGAAEPGGFVGRKEELAALRAGLEGARQGNGGLWLLIGEAGIGKTRTATELVSRAEGFDVHWGRCREGEGAPAFWPWIEIGRSLLRRHDGDAVRSWLGTGASDVSRLLPEVLGTGVERMSEPPSSDDAEAHFRLFDSFASFLCRAAETRPTVLVLDDLHWSDRASLLLLRHVAPLAGQTRLLIVGAYRPVEARRDPRLSKTLSAVARRGEQIPLDGLRRDEVAAFLQIALGAAPNEEIAASLHEKTAGNVLFLAEIARAIARGGVANAIRVDALPPTDGIRHAIGRRFASLSRSSLSVLRTAAVIGREFDTAMLQAAHARLDTGPVCLSILDALEEARRAEIVEVDNQVDRYRFTHPLVRDTLNAELSVSDRAHIHRAVASALEGACSERESLLAELAHHFVAAAALGDTDKAIEYSRLAGDRCRRQFAYEEAVGRYSAALRVLDLESSSHRAAADRDRLRAELLIDLGRAQALAPIKDDGSDAFARAAAIGRALGDPEILAQAALGIVGPGKVGLAGDVTGARLVEEALAALGKVDHPLRPLLLTRSLLPLYYSQERELVLRRSAEAVEMAERVCDGATLGGVLGERLTVLFGPDDIEERAALARRIVALAQETKSRGLDFLGHSWSARNLMQLGEVERARAHVDRCRVVAAETRQPFLLWQVQVFEAMFALLRGDLAVAEELAIRASALESAAGLPNASVMMSIQIFRIRLEQGRLGEMEPIILEFARSMAQIPAARGPVALAYAHLGRLDEARRAFDAVAGADFADFPRDSNFLTGLTDAAHVCWFLADRDRSERLYALLAPHEDLAVMGSWFAACSGTVGHYLGLLATVLRNWSAAADHFDRAEQAYVRMGALPLLARVRIDCAEMLLRAGGDGHRARALLQGAEEALSKLDMPTWRQRCAALLERGAVTETVATPGSDSQGINVFRCDGDFWTISYGGATIRLKDLKGLHLLQTLLREPGREFHVADLVMAPLGCYDAASGDETLPDARARSEYRSRIATLSEVLEESERFNDIVRATRAREEIDQLREQIAAAYMPGPRARSRKRLQENMRKAVAKNIRAALGRIAARDETLGRHLTNSVQTGVFCCYRPERTFHWVLD